MIKIDRPFLVIALFGVLFLLVACSQQQAVSPLKLLWEKSAKGNEILVVFLPGVHDKKEVFIKKGIFKRLKNIGIKADIVAADLHLGYLKAGTTIERIHEDVIIPAKKMGYKKIWLVGISLGGLNALLYMKSRPDAICGVILLSPFLGEKGISDNIIQAGGIHHWQPENRNNLDDEEALWLWLKNTKLNNVFLGTGKSDRFFPLHQQLATLLPDENTTFIDGGHRWSVWQELWQYFTLHFQKSGHFDSCEALPIIPSL